MANAFRQIIAGMRLQFQGGVIIKESIVCVAPMSCYTEWCCLEQLNDIEFLNRKMIWFGIKECTI